MNRMYNVFQRLQTFKIACIPCQQKQLFCTQQKSQSHVAKGIAQKKTKIAPKITLIGLNESVSITSLEEAQKLAKRRDLHLIQLQELDSKTHRPVYKLISASEMLSKELDDIKSPPSDKEKSAHKKSEKSLTIGSRITDHDLSSRLKQITKWLTKSHEVRILIQGSTDDMSNAEKIFKSIEMSVKEPEIVGKIVQKRTKGSIIKFSILPTTPTITPA